MQNEWRLLSWRWKHPIADGVLPTNYNIAVEVDTLNIINEMPAFIIIDMVKISVIHSDYLIPAK